MNTGRKAVEELAKKRGVSLAAPPAPPAPTQAPAAATGWLAKLMPNAAPMMADLRAKCGPEIWSGAVKLLKAGKGYVVDLETNIAVGNPPPDQFTRGKIEERDGLKVMRVRPIKKAG